MIARQPLPVEQRVGVGVFRCRPASEAAEGAERLSIGAGTFSSDGFVVEADVDDGFLQAPIPADRRQARGTVAVRGEQSRQIDLCCDVVVEDYTYAGSGSQRAWRRFRVSSNPAEIRALDRAPAPSTSDSLGRLLAGTSQAIGKRRRGRTVGRTRVHAKRSSELSGLGGRTADYACVSRLASTRA